MSKIVRIEARVPSELNDFITSESERTGLSKNAIVLFAIENYRKEKEVISGMADMGELMRKMEQLESRFSEVIQND